MANFRPAVGVRDVHEHACNDVMERHLGVVFPSLLQIDGKNLLEPEGELHEVVPLQFARYLARGPSGPELLEVKPIGGGYKKVLQDNSLA